MRFGAGFGLTAGDDPTALRAFAQRLDQAGFDLLTVSGHLLSVAAGRYSDRPTATYAGPFHDPFVLFGYLAAVTQRLRFRTSILILPLYATTIVAKQSAELQMLSGGRFELGVGISWNPTEYRAVGQDFTNRGRRLEEQVLVLRRLWSEPLVRFSGRYHQLDDVGLQRVPAQPIPIWMGGTNDERVLRRVARLADGFIPLGDPAEPLARLRQYLAEAGRDVAGFPLAGRLLAGPGGPEAWVESARGLQALGVSDLMLAAPPDLPPAEALERLVEARAALERAL